MSEPKRYAPSDIRFGGDELRHERFILASDHERVVEEMKKELSDEQDCTIKLAENYKTEVRRLVGERETAEARAAAAEEKIEKLMEDNGHVTMKWCKEQEKRIDLEAECARLREALEKADDVRDAYDEVFREKYPDKFSNVIWNYNQARTASRGGAGEGS